MPEPDTPSPISPRRPDPVCPKCYSSLASLPAIGRCPKCDEVYWPVAMKYPGTGPSVSIREAWLRGVFNYSGLALAVCWIVGCFTPLITVVVLLSSVAIATVSGLFLLRFRSKARSRLRDLDFRLCPGCRYVLAGLADAGSCPECGSVYDSHTLKLLWSRTYGIRDAAHSPSGPSCS